ncbi:glycosyltransferase family 87 protein [Parasediminibacterium sp. JCM 36343]|uniref:glycosyltransferase family 87 protein n=1 Tax=Parasediminibacterium sp. JCM 36343 TaxID=3374279 RepID=UPI00397B8F3F
MLAITLNKLRGAATSFISKKVHIGLWHISMPVFIWFLLTIVAVLLEMSRGIDDINNYIIYKQVFWHLTKHQNLFATYPNEYWDLNHYGPLFAIVIAPFALMPVYIGCFFWCIANAWVLYWAIQKLPIANAAKMSIYLIAAVELMTSIHNVQFNAMITGFIILSFVFVEEGNDFWATFFIVIGFLTKIYGIGGLAFFLFSKNKIRFIWSFVFWLVILFALPVIITSPAFLVQSYKDWYSSLVEKNIANINLSAVGGMQDISAMGFIRRVSHYYSMPSWWVLAPAMLLYVLPIIRFKQYQHLPFRLLYLAITLIGVVVLSSSAESPTYVIAVVGVAIWFIAQEKPLSSWKKWLLCFVIIFTSFSSTDFFPPYVRQHFITAYSIKALPCSLVWLATAYQLLVSGFSVSQAKIAEG